MKAKKAQAIKNKTAKNYKKVVALWRADYRLRIRDLERGMKHNLALVENAKKRIQLMKQILKDSKK